MLFHAIKVHENFVFAAVKGDYGEAIYPFFQYAVLIDTPKDIRVQRVKKRSFQKFGNRMLPGGDLHEQEEKFFEFVTSRPESTVEEWIQLLSCSILNSVYTRSGQNSTPNSNATNLHSSQKRCCSFCISSSNASPTFQVQKSIFHQMTKPIQVTVILPLLLAISFSRNDDIHSSISGISNDLIGVIPTIGQ